MFDRIVVALDGSERGERALDAGTELAGRLGVPVHLLRVADVAVLRLWAGEASLAYAEFGGEMAAEQREAHDYLDAIAARLRAAGLAVTTEVRPGLADREIVAAAGPGDLLVVASHGRSGPARWLLGSVAEDVARGARGPVLLVRTGD